MIAVISNDGVDVKGSPTIHFFFNRQLERGTFGGVLGGVARQQQVS